MPAAIASSGGMGGDTGWGWMIRSRQMEALRERHWTHTHRKIRVVMGKSGRLGLGHSPF